MAVSKQSICFRLEFKNTSSPNNAVDQTDYTNILISGRWVLSDMGIQKTDTDKSVLTETISSEPYAGELVSKHPDSKYEYADAIESALPSTA